MINIANGPYCGYLPPMSLYDQDLYPVWQTPYERGSLERTYEAACVALASFTHSGRPLGTHTRTFQASLPGARNNEKTDQKQINEGIV